MLDLTNYCALKFTNFKAELKLYVHYRNTHAYTHLYSYIIAYILLLCIIQLFITVIILAYYYSTGSYTCLCLEIYVSMPMISYITADIGELIHS